MEGEEGITESSIEITESEKEAEVVEVRGKDYMKVTIEGYEGDYLMDEEENLYNMEMEQIGDADGLFPSEESDY